MFILCVVQAEDITLTVAESFQIAKELSEANVDKHVTSATPSSGHAFGSSLQSNTNDSMVCIFFCWLGCFGCKLVD
jgi:hypothetical protein